MLKVFNMPNSTKTRALGENSLPQERRIYCKIDASLALSYGSWLMEDNVRLGDYNIRRGSVVHVLRRPNPVPISDVGSQVSQYRVLGKDESESKADSGVGDLLIVRPSPIKRLSVQRIPEPVTSSSEAVPIKEAEEVEVAEREAEKGMEENEQTPRPITPPPVPKLGDGESLRLNLPETEVYRNFRQALCNRMVTQKGQNGAENNA
ncbi:hypothetical protein TcWFU_001361 [Taenia crassiceps]|uniref:Ubiquitin-like domain-containing protein n=1 Tax=Taenia crassiceps TaxID=6207 RepID=A0ABR4QP92_9CEST